MSKTYFLDTNIILDSTENLLTLSNNGENIIVIPDIVLDEIDSKKTGFEAINYNAREFNRYCEKAELLETTNINHTARRVVVKNGDVIMHFVSLIEHEFNESNTDYKILNDRKIIDTADKIKQEYEGMVILSNDIAFRTRSLLLGVDVKPFKENDVDPKATTTFLKYTYESEEDLKLPLSVDIITDEKSIVGFELLNLTTGKPLYGYRDGTNIREIDEALLQKQNCVPINIRQKVLSQLMLSPYNDIIISIGAAGSGKNILAFSAACALRDIKGAPYEKIVYIRKTVTSVDNKQEDLGFLPGDLDAKMNGFLRPLYNSVEFLIKRKYSSFKPKSKEDVEEKVKEFISSYNIQYEYEGFLRGGTIANAIVICDEFQNESRDSARLLLSRIGENCKVFVLGDIKQIDNQYVNKQNNGLSFLMEQTKYSNDFGVNLVGLHLTETVRSKIAKWADALI